MTGQWSGMLPPMDISPIYTRLFQGARPPLGTELSHAGFSVVVLCAEEYKPPTESFPGVEVLRCPLDDTQTPMPDATWHAIQATAQRVQRRIRANQNVLVTCQMGLNRSGIVSASALHYLTGSSGCSTAAFIQRRRRHALSNPQFVRELCARLPELALRTG